MTLTQKQHRSTVNQSLALVAVLLAGVVAIGWILSRILNHYGRQPT